MSVSYIYLRNQHVACRSTCFLRRVCWFMTKSSASFCANSSTLRTELVFGDSPGHFLRSTKFVGEKGANGTVSAQR